MPTNSFAKSNVIKTDTDEKYPKINIVNNLPNMIVSNTSSKLFHLKFDHKSPSKSLPQEVVPKHEKNVQKSASRNTSGKVFNIAKISPCIFQGK